MTDFQWCQFIIRKIIEPCKRGIAWVQKRVSAEILNKPRKSLHKNDDEAFRLTSITMNLSNLYGKIATKIGFYNIIGPK